MKPDIPDFQPDVKREAAPTPAISHVDPEDRAAVAAYYKFEVDNGFSAVHPKTTFEEMVDYRQQQLRGGKLKVVIGREGNEPVATSVVVLEPGTMGKQFRRKTEAWAGGTVVAPDRRGERIGERMASMQDEIARKAGRRFLLTNIEHDNTASMRLRMRVGFEIDGVETRKPVIMEQLDPLVAYRYRKDLWQEPAAPPDVRSDVISGTVRVWNGQIDERTPDRILLDPKDSNAIGSALENSYRGKWLVLPDDFEKGERPIDRPFLLFVRAKQPHVEENAAGDTQ